MRLSKENILSLIETRRIDGMPNGMFVAGFEDVDGVYYPIEALDINYDVGRECELTTQLAHALGGIECYLWFI